MKLCVCPFSIKIFIPFCVLVTIYCEENTKLKKIRKCSKILETFLHSNICIMSPVAALLELLIFLSPYWQTSGPYGFIPLGDLNFLGSGL